MSEFKSDSKYADVAALSMVAKDTTVPNGETWEINLFQGSAAYLDGTDVCLIWDPAGADVILACTHGDTRSSLFKKVTGDGTKVLRIELTNDTDTPYIMGAAWEGQKL